jgi:competence protein ComEC
MPPVNFKSFLRQNPLLLVAIGAIVGAEIAYYGLWVDFLLAPTAIYAIAGWIVLLWLLVLWVQIGFILRALMAVGTVILLMGIYTAYFNQIPLHHIQSVPNQEVELKGTVESIPKRGRFGYSFTLLVDSVSNGTQFLATTGKVYVQVSAKGLPAWREETRLQMKGKLFQLPDTIAFYEYLRQQHIYQRLKTKQVDVIGQNSSWRSPFLTLRDRCWQQIYRHMEGYDEPAIASAILLGIRVDVPQDLKQAYTQAGLAHVLALSGSHIVVILLLLSRMLYVFRFFARTHRLEYILCIIVLSVYLVMTGFSPPAVRAVLMGCLVLVARLLQRPVAVFNLMAFSMITQMLFNPLVYRDIGFQLSYLAVFGIIGFYAFFEDTTSTATSQASKSGLVKAIADFAQNAYESLISAIKITIGAQLMTTPLILFYFGAFPIYFLVANLAAFWISSWIVIVGMLFITIGQLDVLGHWLGMVLSTLIQWLNDISKTVSSWENASMNVSLTFWELLFLYLLMAIGYTGSQFLKKATRSKNASPS